MLVGRPRKEKMPKAEFDVKSVTKWEAPKDNGAKILTMPNIPMPLHMLAPRTVLGKTTWDHMRKKCYYEAGYKCQACGKILDRGQCHAHELYTVNYETGDSKFERCVCLCEMCHVRGIHSGRALTMIKKGNPLMTKKLILEGAENLFRIINDYNVTHRNEEPLRAYATFVDYAKWPPLADEMRELIDKYDMKFYREDSSKLAEWSDWSLTIGNRTYPTPYANQEEWEKAMEKNNQVNHNAAIQEKSEIDLEIDKILGLT